MAQRYSTAFSYMLLAGTSMICFYKYHTCGCGWRLPCGSYLIIITNSLLGVWRWGNPDYGDRVEKPYQFTTFLQTILPLPFAVTQMWLICGYNVEWSYMHTIASILPFHFYVANNNKKRDIQDLIIAINCTSLCVISFIHENYYGISAAVSYLINHFILRDDVIEVEEVPMLDLYNYGLCFFCYFTLQALKH